MKENRLPRVWSHTVEVAAPTSPAEMQWLVFAQPVAGSPVWCLRSIHATKRPQPGQPMERPLSATIRLTDDQSARIEALLNEVFDGHVNALQLQFKAGLQPAIPQPQPQPRPKAL